MGHKHKPNLESFSLIEIIERVVDRYRDRLAQRSIDFRVIDNQAGSVTSDPDLTAIVFENLLVNSMEAIANQGGDSGWIKAIIGKVGGDAGGDSGVRVSVTDSGVGWSGRDLDRAFEPFYSTKQKRYGLGLAIVLNIMTAINGEARLRPLNKDGVVAVELDFPIKPEPEGQVMLSMGLSDP